MTLLSSLQGGFVLPFSRSGSVCAPDGRDVGISGSNLPQPTAFGNRFIFDI
jgi:hypothetical protein